MAGSPPPAHNRKTHEALCRALEATLLFHSGGAWTKERQASWRALIGDKDVTTKELCNHIRETLRRAGRSTES